MCGRAISSYCSLDNMIAIKAILYLADVAHSPLWLCPSDVYASRIPIHTHTYIHRIPIYDNEIYFAAEMNEYEIYIYVQCVFSMELAGVRQHVQHARELIVNGRINEIDGQMSATATDRHFQILLFRRRNCSWTDSKLKQSRRIYSMLALCVRCVWTRECVCAIWYAPVVNCMDELCTLSGSAPKFYGVSAGVIEINLSERRKSIVSQIFTSLCVTRGDGSICSSLLEKCCLEFHWNRCARFAVTPKYADGEFPHCVCSGFIDELFAVSIENKLTGIVGVCSSICHLRSTC